VKTIFNRLINELRRYLYNRKQKRIYFSLIQNFFNLNITCDSRLYEWESLRTSYIKSLNVLKKYKICQGCNYAFIKSDYIARLVNSQKYLNNIMSDQIMIDFFNFEQPCPSEIPYCEQLRQKYKEELEKLSATGCSTCKKNTLKSKYIKDIWENHISKVI
jgi:hypothetical protein